MNEMQLKLINEIQENIEKHIDRILDLKEENEDLINYEQDDLDLIQSELSEIISKNFKLLATMYGLVMTYKKYAKSLLNQTI